jgi:organic radical activating enzyme
LEEYVLIPKFWNWFKLNGKKLQRLQVAGGEPFLQKDVYTLIDHFESNPYPDLEFNIITNLSIESKIIQPRLNKLVESLKKDLAWAKQTIATLKGKK